MSSIADYFGETHYEKAIEDLRRQRNILVDHPDHYGGKDSPYEAIKVIEAWDLDFCLGNVVKYISRAGKKNGESTMQDLQKAAWYLDRAIKKKINDA
jgi:hypothetical protein